MAMFYCKYIVKRTFNSQLTVSLINVYEFIIKEITHVISHTRAHWLDINIKIMLLH